jgi:inorganic triphosphatase YgiF
MLDTQELEGKFSCQREDLARVLLLDHIGAFRLTRRDERTQTDLYFDTASLSLRDQSCSLRMRSVGDKHKATFKGPRQAVDTAEDAAHAHLVARLEIEVAVVPAPLDGAAFIERLDLEPVSRARNLIGVEEQLNPIARLVTHRQMLHYEREAGEIIELSLDDVDALDLRNDRATHILEVELELIEGTPETLVSAADSLRAAVPMLRPSVDSKLARTLGQTSQPAEAG